jgi:hypothetical protein
MYKFETSNFKLGFRTKLFEVLLFKSRKGSRHHTCSSQFKYFVTLSCDRKTHLFIGLREHHDREKPRGEVSGFRVFLILEANLDNFQGLKRPSHKHSPNRRF